jgi:hypothetical protein
MLEMVPLSLDEANEFVRQYHRHHQPTVGHKFSIGVAEDGKVVGVAIVGRPLARMLDDGWTVEVNRTCTDGIRNVNSKLYGACKRAAEALGYRRIITYTLPNEGGASLRAVGWKQADGLYGGGTWSTPNCGRIRADDHPLDQKCRWEMELNGNWGGRDEPFEQRKAMRQQIRESVMGEEGSAQLSFTI